MNAILSPDIYIHELPTDGGGTHTRSDSSRPGIGWYQGQPNVCVCFLCVCVCGCVCCFCFLACVACVFWVQASSSGVLCVCRFEKFGYDFCGCVWLAVCAKVCSQCFCVLHPKLKNGFWAGFANPRGNTYNSR
jgi:hypothetical protein